jgi:hypothetical protein
MVDARYLFRQLSPQWHTRAVCVGRREVAALDVLQGAHCGTRRSRCEPRLTGRPGCNRHSGNILASHGAALAESEADSRGHHVGGFSSEAALGKLAADTAEAVREKGWPAVVEQIRGESNISSGVQNIQHKASRILQHLRHKGLVCGPLPHHGVSNDATTQYTGGPTSPRTWIANSSSRRWPTSALRDTGQCSHTTWCACGRISESRLWGLCPSVIAGHGLSWIIVFGSQCRNLCNSHQQKQCNSAEPFNV